METYLVLIRGINVGGKNKMPMTVLRQCLERLGFAEVSTYIASGNVILNSDKNKDEVKKMVEAALPENFKLDSEILKVLVITYDQLKKVVDQKPAGFGDRPDIYHSDAIFLIDIGVDKAMAVFSPHEGVDSIWPGEGVVYSQRLSAQRTKSRLNKITESPLYKSMTIRNWNTTTKLLALLTARIDKIRDT